MKTFPDFEIIDAHVHPFSREFGANIAGYGAPASPEEFAAELRELGIHTCCGSFIVNGPCGWREIERANREALRFRDRFPDFYHPGIQVHGEFPEKSCEQLKQLSRENVRWIGELVPYLMNTGEYTLPGMMRILACAEELGMVVNVHLHPIPITRLEDILRHFPGLNVVLAHPGDFADTAKRLPLVARYPNLYLDISGTGLFRWNFLRHAIDTCGVEKLLFGSDFPVCSPGMNLYGALCEHLTEAEFKLLFSENYKRITGRI